MVLACALQRVVLVDSGVAGQDREPGLPAVGGAAVWLGGLIGRGELHG